MRRSRARRYRRTRRTGRRRTFGSALRKKNGFTRRTGYYGRYHSTYASNVPAFKRRVELKFHDTAQGLINIPTAGVVSGSLFTIPQNTSENGRIGRNVLVSKVMFKGEIHLKNQTSLILGHDMARVIMFWDTQTNGATATVLDILESADVNSFRNLANSKRFRILYDRVHVIQSQAATITSADVVVTQKAIRLISYYVNVNIPVEYDGTDGTLSTIKSNNISVLYISKDNRTEIQGEYRVRYTG